MLAVLSPALPNCDGREVADEFSDGFLAGVPLRLEDIDIDFDDDILLGFGGDLLPDLGDPDEIFADFSIDGGYGEDKMGNEAKALEVIRKCDQEKELLFEEQEEEVASASTGKEDGPNAVSTVNSPSSSLQKTEKSSKGKGSQGKRKVKVDWTPELHRRFVQAVEQLGLDKAVPSRILELMGIDCLTRHNIASHLQKYRSHRKHLQAREAEAASWRQRQQMYSSSVTAGAAKKESSPWIAPAMALPPQTQPAYRPLHVWGHPPIDPNLLHLWPKHLHLHLHRPPPPMPWALPPPPPPHLSIWPAQYPTGANALTHGMPYFPRPMPAMRFPSPSVPGIPPHSLYGPESAVCLKAKSFETDDPSKESIDALIGNVIAKPWLPLPLGLKAPSVESVIKELQKQGISKIPPNA